MAYEVMILCHLHMPLYFLGIFTEYPEKDRPFFIPYIPIYNENETNLPL